MSDFTWWVVAAMALLGLELASGALYLLALAVAAGAGALAALAGFGQTTQLLLAAVIGVVTTRLAHGYRSKHRSSAGVQDNPDVLADIGQVVEVTQWGANRRAFAQFRGARWELELDAETDLAQAAAPGSYRIVRIDGIRLIVVPV